MRVFFALLLAVLVAETASGDERVERARRAMADGLPQAAVPTLQAVLDDPEVSDDSEVRILLGRALLASRRPEKVREILEPLIGDPDAAFYLAQAEAGMGNPLRALEIFTSVLRSDEATHRAEAALAAAHMLVELGRARDAIEVLGTLGEGELSGEAAVLEAEILVDLNEIDAARKALARSGASESPSIRSRLVSARIALAEERYEEAYRKFADLSASALVPSPSLAARATIGAAEARAALGDLSEAQRQLEHFVDQSPGNPQLARIFAKLDALYAADSTVSNSQLLKWANEEADAARRAYALFYLAKNQWRNGDRGDATDTMQKFIREHSRHSHRRNASELLARWFLEEGEHQYALNVLDQFRSSRSEQAMDGRLIFLRAEAFAGINEFAAAAHNFRAAARMDRELRPAAVRNARLLELRTGIGSPDGEEYDFPAAMELARQRDASADAVLQSTASRLSPEEQVDLTLARAELEYLRGDHQKAKNHLIRVSNETDELSEDQEARRNYLEIFLAGTSTAEAKAAAERFLEAHPNSLFEAEVRVKLGEILYERGDYTAARLQLATAARQTSEPSLRETALFMAGQAARRELSDSSRDDALGFFEEVAGVNGRLAERARLEQAVIKAAQDDSAGATVILDQLIANSSDEQLAAQAALRKGDLLFGSAADAETHAEAAAHFSQLAGQPGLTASLRNEALTKAGIAFQKAGEPDQALAMFHRVMDAPQEGNPDLFWFYKAGFEAGRLLENQKLFKEAVAVYQKLAQIKGPRSDEAKERVNRLRLENLLWEDSP